MNEILLLLGIALIFVGIFLIITYSILNIQSGKTEFSFVGLIGPIPIVISNSKDLLIISLIILVIFIALLILLLKLF